jgi:serine/threonine-protein kinase
MLTTEQYIGKYKILNELGAGEGGMSTVYLALDEKLNQTWAIKVAQRSGIQDDNKAIQGLVADRDTLLHLKHKYLPRIVDVFEDENSMKLVMDFIEGKSLHYWTENNGARPQNDVIKWAKQLCDVIGYLHSKNIIYRDLKPANIMLNSNNDITLIDFGTARQLENIRNTVTMGTYGYCAPEQFADSAGNIAVNVDARSDIYCIGATLHHLITGVDPQRNPSFVKKPIRDFNPQLSEGLETIIEKCCQNEKADRYQSCAELLVDLENYQGIGKTIRKKNWRKVIGFLIPVALTVVFAATSVFSYVAAENQLSEDYDRVLTQAANNQISQEEREKLYLDAIQIIDYQPEAYSRLIDLFVNGSVENEGRLSRHEVEIIRQLENGLNSESKNGYAGTIYPLQSLEQRDKAAYEQICYDMGTAFWYDYEVSSERHTNAISWFEKAMPSYAIAQTFMDIGEAEKNIRTFQGQSRTEKMYEAYQQLFDSFKKFKSDAISLDDNDIKFFVWREIVDNISENAGYFLEKVSRADLAALLDGIASDALSIKSDANTNGEIKKNIGVDPEEYSESPNENKGTLLFDISEAKKKINSGKSEG